MKRLIRNISWYGFPSAPANNTWTNVRQDLARKIADPLHDPQSNPEAGGESTGWRLGGIY